MPNIKSSIKRVKISQKKNLENRMIKSNVKTAIKKFETELATNPSAAAELLSVTSSKIDRAVAKGVMHKNAANRKKAHMAKSLA